MDTVIMIKRLGTRIESLRHSVGMTRNDLAHKTGMHPMQVTLAEEGKLPISQFRKLPKLQMH